MNKPVNVEGALQYLVDNLQGLSLRDRRMAEQLIRETRQMNADLEAAKAAERAKIDNAKLPDCVGFQGTGQRCSSCRVHKKMHP